MRSRSSKSRISAPFPLLFALLVGACSSSEGAASNPDASADSATDAAVDAPLDADAAACALVAKYSSSNVPCNDCAEAKCCAEVNGCLGDPRCNDDYVNCILACALLPDDAGPDAAGATQDCVAKCDVDFPVGYAEYQSAIGCVDAKCTAECQ